MDYRRRKKIQLKTPEVIPGGVTVRKGKKEKRKREKRGRGKHSLTRSPKKPLGSPEGQEGGGRKGKKNKRGNGNTSESMERPKCDMGNGIAGWTGQERGMDSGKVLIAPRLTGNTPRFSFVFPQNWIPTSD